MEVSREVVDYVVSYIFVFGIGGIFGAITIAVFLGAIFCFANDIRFFIDLFKKRSVRKQSKLEHDLRGSDNDVN